MAFNVNVGTASRPALPALVAAVLVGAIPGCSGCSKRLQETALRQQALDMCDTLTHQSGDACRSEVERRFPGCSRRFFAAEVSSEGYAQCLGFVVPHVSSGSSVALEACDAPNISARISIFLAKGATWEGSTTRVINGQTLHLSDTPTIATPDLRALRIEEHGGDRVVAVELSEQAAGRLAAATRANIGDSMVLTLNESVVVTTIVSAVVGPKLVISAPEARIQDLCKTP